MSNHFWEIPWSADQISRFWAWQAKYMQQNYFALKMGSGIIDTLRRHRSLANTLVCDYGAGPGFLTPHLLESGAKVIAIDQSMESLEALRTKYPAISGTCLADQTHSLGDAVADVVLLVETIEHLLPEVRDKVLSDIRRLLKVDGVLFVTCPNAEDLSENMICCPNCLGVFHRVQHVESFSEKSLGKTLRAAGFASVTVGVTYFSPSLWVRRRKNFSAKWFGRKLPHLYAIACRS